MQLDLAARAEPVNRHQVLLVQHGLMAARDRRWLIERVLALAVRDRADRALLEECSLA